MNSRIKSFDDVLQHAARVPLKRILVVNPANAETFRAIADAGRQLPTYFLLLGDPDLITKGLAEAGAGQIRAEIADAPTGTARWSWLSRLRGTGRAMS